MKASEIKFVDLFTGANTRYSIPVYQRNYSWTTTQCMQLWNDLKNLEADKSHFFGSVVLSFEANGEHQVIDGQQRLTTVSLLWAAMLSFLPKDERLTMGHLANTIYSSVCYATGVEQFAPRIEHVERDRAPYKAIIDGADTTQHKESSVFQNYDLFIRNLRAITAEERKAIYDATCRLSVVRIDLQQGDNPQLIFESLNATGLQLGGSDKIRNYLLMNVAPQQQEALYKNYWVAIEGYTESIRRKKNEDEVTFFIREYMAAKEGQYTPLPQVYPHFKKFAKDAENVEALMRDTARHARLLDQFVNSKTAYAKVNTVARRIAYLGFSTVYPFAMNLLAGLQDGEISENDAEETLYTLEAYLTRRKVCGLPSNALNSIMPTLYDQAKQLLGRNNGKRLPDAVAYILTRKSGQGAFPTDARFAKAWEICDVYNMRGGDARSYILAMLNATMSSNGHVGKGVVIGDMVESLGKKKGKSQADNSIEHIMPQTLSESWVADLGGEETAKAAHERWLHTIANLTITGYNSELSNRPFLEKVRCGFAQSSHPINDFIKEQTHWGEEQLEERLRLLADNANRIWPQPNADGFDGDLYEYLTLDNAPGDFTGTKFVSGTVCGERIVGLDKKSWVNVLKTVTQMLNVSHHPELAHMANDPAQGSFMRNETTKDERSCEIDDGIYARFMKMSAVSMTTTMRGIVDYLGIDRDQIRFKVQRTDTSDLRDADLDEDEATEELD